MIFGGEILRVRLFFFQLAVLAILLISCSNEESNSVDSLKEKATTPVAPVISTTPVTPATHAATTTTTTTTIPAATASPAASTIPAATAIPTTPVATPAATASPATSAATASPAISATPAAPVVTPVATPLIQVASPIFSQLNGYSEFNSDLQYAFSTALTNEFNSVSGDKMGISVAVYQNGKLWSMTQGMATIDRPLYVETPFAVMSTSKTFLSALILSQIEKGLYHLDDRSSELLSGIAGFESLDKNIFPDRSVEELLLHRSGLAGRASKAPGSKEVMAMPNWHPMDTLNLVTDSAGPTGSFAYRNTNSWLLGLIAENQTGKDLNTLYQNELLNPLSIQAGLRPHITTPEGFANPHAIQSRYSNIEGGFGDLTLNSEYVDAGLDFIQADARLSWSGSGMVSTAESMAVWGYELYSENGRAVSDSVRSQLLNSFNGELVDFAGTLDEYQYGYHISKKEHTLRDGSIVLTYGHPGGGAGSASRLYYAPSLDLAVSVLANSEIDKTSIGTCGNLRAGDYTNPMECFARDIFEELSR